MPPCGGSRNPSATIACAFSIGVPVRRCRDTSRTRRRHARLPPHPLGGRHRGRAARGASACRRPLAPPPCAQTQPRAPGWRRATRRAATCRTSSGPPARRTGLPRTRPASRTPPRRRGGCGAYAREQSSRARLEAGGCARRFDIERFDAWVGVYADPPSGWHSVRSLMSSTTFPRADFAIRSEVDLAQFAGILPAAFASEK